MPRVKQASIRQLFLASTLTGLGLVLLGFMTQDEEAHIDHFGSALVSALASQAIEPLQAEDLIHLGVLINRAAALEEVSGASIHSLGNEPLALSGDVRRGRVFTEQVINNGQSVGVVRIHIDEARFGGSFPWAFLLAGVIWVGLVPLVVLGASQISLSNLDFRPARSNPPDAHAAPTVIVPEPEPEPCYLIAVNLFNQLSLSPERCARELDLARMTTERIAALYHGEVADLPGTGLLVSFDTSHSDDRPFHVLCAAFALSQLLADPGSEGRYRLGVHTLMLGPDEALNPKSEEVKDTAVLSALAKDNTIIASNAIIERVPYAERVVTEPVVHPLLEDLESIGTGAHLARALMAPHDELVAQQLAELRGETDEAFDADQSDRPRPSTASESTF